MTSNFFGDNVKLLRKRSKLTQRVLAGQLAITRSKLNCIELNQTKSPSLNDLLKFSEIFRISIDDLIKTDLKKLPEKGLQALENDDRLYITGSKIRVLTITVDKNNRENIEDVPISAQAGYINGFADPDFIGALPKFTLPDLPERGTFRRFPINGDSMLIEDGSKVIAEFVTNWYTLKKGTPCIVILRSAPRPVFKLVTIEQGNPEVLLASLNPTHVPFTVSVDDIAELWKFHSFTSNKLPEPEHNIKELYTIMKEIKKSLENKSGEG